ncbi:surface lipoprotein assembly modifier [Lonepinella sp. BR2474]|uniref:surface lipoprotein assembly modifier n=1 Tax=Lonepinella sp. BR2474 TaxID=3434548 RepID=UPI003F6DCA52
MTKNHLIHTALFLFFSTQVKADITVQNEPDKDIKVATPTLPVALAPNITPEQVSSADTPNIIEFTDDELIQHPEIARQLLNNLIDTQQWELVERLIPLYQQTPQPDVTLIEYAKANLELAQSELRPAIKRLRQILSENDNFAPVRFLLAKALYEDYQDSAAQDQFERLRADNPPAEIAQINEQYLNALHQRNSWDLSFNFSYLQENNVNNAAKSDRIHIGNSTWLKSPESLPQKAHGINYGFNLSKKFNLLNGHYILFENDFSAKQYWDNHQFDDIINRTSLGYQYQNTDNRLAILPFYEWRWLGNHRYTGAFGTRAEVEHWFSPNWRLSVAGEWGKTKQIHYADANSHTALYSGTLMYLPDAKRYFYLGTDYSKERANDAIYSYHRKSLRAGWGQSWWAGISTRLNLYYAHKNYQTPHRLLLKTRQDKEWGGTLTLWKQNWHFWGITPKLSYSFNKVSSNLSELYSYDKQRLFLNFEKTF